MVKYVASCADKENGICRTTVSNGGRQYTGIAKLADGDNWSEIFGCRIAELRATVSALNDVIDTKRMELKAIENFLKASNCYKNFDSNSATAACLYRQVNRKKKEILKLKEQRAGLKKFIIDSIEMREKIEKRITNKK